MHLPEGEDTLAVEEPLEIRVEGTPTAVTMRTPGDDLDLTLGFLATEGVIGPDAAMDDVAAIAQISSNVVDVRLADGVLPSRARSADRALFATSSCGICGKASIDRILRGRPTKLNQIEPTDALLIRLTEQFEAAQRHTRTTGCMHAAALFNLSGDILCLREDVGRHNAVDKVIGAWLRTEQEFDNIGVVVTSRAGFEVVQKAITVGVGLVCTVGAPTTLAVDIAQESGCALVGWLRPGRSRRYA